MCDRNKIESDKIYGTVEYMSPDLLKTGKVDIADDYWAFGVILYEMITGNVM